MMGLMQRLSLAVRDWKDDRRDARLLKDFLNSPKNYDQLKERVLPTTRLLMILLEKLAEGGVDKAEIKLRGYAVSCDSPVGFSLPADVGCRWVSLLKSCATSPVEDPKAREFRIALATQDTPVMIECRLPKTERRSFQDIIDCPGPEEPFLVLAKLPA